MSKHVYIGYWKSTRDYENNIPEYYGFNEDGSPSNKELPYPVENSATEDQIKIINLLRQQLETGYLTSYREWSSCRLCGKHNGSKELEVIIGGTKYSIPIGYIHYLEDHNVAVDPMLITVLEFEYGFV